MGTVTINGVQYSGNNISINGGRVTIDGKDQTPESKVINISVVGNVEYLTVDACEKVEITGDVGSLDTMSGDVYCRDVKRNVKTMSGDVSCGAVGGDVETMSGDIRNAGVRAGKAGFGGSGD